MPPGIDPVFHPEQVPDPAAPLTPYLIYIGSPAPAKNLKALLNAYAMDTDLPPLVLLGVDEREADLVCPDAIRNRVIALGHLNDSSRVARLLANAKVLLAPSLYESFGLPCLEAMACATPVIASDLPAHREVCQNAAAYVQPSDPNAWCAAIQEVVGDPNLRRQMSKAGQVRAKAYDWSNSVKTLRRVLEQQDQAAAR